MASLKAIELAEDWVRILPALKGHENYVAELIEDGFRRSRAGANVDALIANTLAKIAERVSNGQTH